MPYSPVANDTRKEAICEALRRGTTRKAAAQIVSIHPDTFYEWMSSDPSFSERVTRAEADAQHFYEQAIRKAAEGYQVEEEVTRETKDGTFTTTTTATKWHPELASWWLERRRRGDYGPSLDLRQLPTDKLLELFLAATGQAGDEEPVSLQSLARKRELSVIEGSFKAEKGPAPGEGTEEESGGTP